MSMDLILYTAACALSLPLDLPDADHWKNYGRTDWAYETDSWQVIVDIDTSSEIPDAVKGLKAGLEITVPITLEPLGANGEGYAFLERTTQKIIEKCGGGVLDGPDGLRAY
jgi:hypothetical protein